MKDQQQKSHAQLEKELSLLKKRNEKLERLEMDRIQIEAELKGQANKLKERIKELNCLYGISKLIEKSGSSLDSLYKNIVDLIPSSWQYPEITSAIIKIRGKEYKTINFYPTQWKQSADIVVNGKKAGTLTVNYLEEKPIIHHGPFLKEERLLLNAIAERLGRTTEHKLAEKKLKENEQKLKKQNMLLQDKNIALREMANQLIIEKKNLKEKMLTNVDNLLLPMIKRMHSKGTSIDRQYMLLLEDNLKKITSSFGNQISRRMHHLTAREIEICNLVRSGLSSKEIAGFLDITPRTVETYRNYIRKKLGLINKKVSLSTYLKIM